MAVNLWLTGQKIAVSVRDGIRSPDIASYRFLTADDRLLAIAQAEGLLVDNPNWHP